QPPIQPPTKHPARLPVQSLNQSTSSSVNPPQNSPHPPVDLPDEEDGMVKPRAHETSFAEDESLYNTYPLPSFYMSEESDDVSSALVAPSVAVLRQRFADMFSDTLKEGEDVSDVADDTESFNSVERGPASGLAFEAKRESTVWRYLEGWKMFDFFLRVLGLSSWVMVEANGDGTRTGNQTCILGNVGCEACDEDVESSRDAGEMAQMRWRLF
ncbi:hypothetical protein BT69DRAFT_1338416, partial [Atractiella rhizophila]